MWSVTTRIWVTYLASSLCFFVLDVGTTWAFGWARMSHLDVHILALVAVVAKAVEIVREPAKVTGEAESASL